MPNNRINILYHVACYMLYEARTLFSAGTGEDIYGNDLQDLPGEMENIPSDTETYRWANACVSFIRYFAHILASAIEEQNIPPSILADVANVFDNDENEI